MKTAGSERKEEERSFLPTPSTLTSSVSFQAFMRLTREIEEKTTTHITLSLSP